MDFKIDTVFRFFNCLLISVYLYFWLQLLFCCSPFLIFSCFCTMLFFCGLLIFSSTFKCFSSIQRFPLLFFHYFYIFLWSILLDVVFFPFLDTSLLPLSYCLSTTIFDSCIHMFFFPTTFL